MSAMHDFLARLHESGQVVVLPFGLDRLAGEPLDAFPMLRRMDEEARLEFPGDAPAFSWPVAHWAAETFYRACQLLVCRDVSAADTLAVLRVACPQPPSPEAHYSADLVLRFLPDLLGTAQRLAAGDALVDALRELALGWPLSSVGVPGLEPGGLQHLDSLFVHPGLCRLYADRILQRCDKTRLLHDQARTAVETALGQHAELCPEIAACLFGN